jgi:hypothetical protein
MYINQSTLYVHTYVNGTPRLAWFDVQLVGSGRKSLFIQRFCGLAEACECKPPCYQIILSKAVAAFQYTARHGVRLEGVKWMALASGLLLPCD